MATLKRLVDRFVGKDDRKPIFKCTTCGCTYRSNDNPCSECWNNRLVLIE